MNSAEELSIILNNLLNNKKFLATLMIDEEEFDELKIIDKLSKVLCYYIATRDKRTDYTFKEIEEKYDSIENEELKGIYYQNLIENGIVTTSFNGYKKELINKYGFNYNDKISEEQRNNTFNRRKALNKLEEICGRSQYLEIQEKAHIADFENQVYLTKPGGSTFFNALMGSPERLYQGPLLAYTEDGFGERKPIIIGEKKKTFFKKVLLNEIYPTKYLTERNIKNNEIIESVRTLVENFCSLPPSIALINISRISDIPMSDFYYNAKHSRNLKNMLDMMNFHRIKDFFLVRQSEETNTELTNLVTLSEYIPKDSFSIIDVMDIFEMKQLYAKLKGHKVGQLIDYTNCKYIGEASINQLMSILNDIDYINDLDELQESYLKRKQYVKNQYSEKFVDISSLYNTSEISELEKIKIYLQQDEEKILQRDYISKNENPPLELRYSINKLKASGKWNKLLESDDKIIQDELQYDSELHGLSHTRRVNFFATLIIEQFFKEMTDDSRKIIEAIVINHDIGRENDLEDREHGKRSVQILKSHPERLESFYEDEKSLIEFVIKEHSLGTKENISDLNEIADLEELENCKIALKIFKDADKLDRIRLDPFGKYPEEGLDASRLSLSKDFENIAYEAYDKILDVLDIEKQIADIDKFLELDEEIKQFSEFETKLKNRRAVLQSKNNKFLEDIVQSEEVTLKSMELFLKRAHNITINSKKDKEQGIGK